MNEAGPGENSDVGELKRWVLTGLNIVCCKVELHQPPLASRFDRLGN